jgi:cell division protein ZipA
MDSLLLVLTVIGVILILAGVARMRSKRKPHRDEIDHSVLFDSKHNGNNEELLDDEFVIRKVRRIESPGSDPVIHAEQHNFDDDHDQPRIDAEDEIRIEVDDAETPHPTQEERPIARDRARSILSKLRMETKEEASQPETFEPIKRYRDSAPDKVIVLNVMAPKGQHFAGPALVDAIESLGMVYGEMEIFHYYSDNAPLFSLVNMVKPGIFDMATIETLTTPGVSIFIQLPNKQGNGLEAFDTMLNVAQRLNTTLGGSLCDERRNILTHSAIDYTRQQLAEYDCKWLSPA